MADQEAAGGTAIVPPVFLDLYYLAQRDYVNGLTLFEEMIKAYTHSTGNRPEHIKKFQVNKWVRTDATLEIHRTADLRGNRRAREASARIDLLAGGEPVSLLFYPVDDSPVDNRFEEYDRQAYVASAEQSEDGTLRARPARIGNMFDLVRAVVEANYQYVVQEAGKLGIEKGVSWAYLNEFPFLGDDQARKIVEVVYAEPKIFDARGNRYYVRSLWLTGLDAGPAEMCYYFSLP